MSDRSGTSARKGGQGRPKAASTPTKRQGPPTRQGRLLGRAVPLVAIAAGAFGVGIVVGSSGSVSDEAQAFAKAWERQDFEAMHSQLTPAAQDEFTGEELAATYADTQATATAIEVATGEVSAEGGEAVFTATVETKAFGEVAGLVTLPVDEEGAVEWAPHLTFPGLEAGEALDRRTRLGERAAILAADGTPLAEGPASARTSPLGPSALAIAGGLGSPSRSQDQDQFALGAPRGTLVGTSGLELAFNERLAGQPSGELFAVSDSGEERAIASGEPRDGEDVKTTIDPEVQSAAVTALGDRYGGIAVIDAKKGDVRGVAGLAFSAPQPPGSTFKIITATAALDAGVVELDDEFPVEVSNTTIGREITNAGDSPCGGTFVQSFAESCNTVFAPLGVEVGSEKLIETAEAFGFGSPPSLAAAEALEALAPPAPSLGEIESDVALGETSIGQGQVLATPLAMASVAQTIANDGVRMPTSLVKTKELRTELEPVEVTSPETSEKIESMMVEVVRSGTSTAAQIPGIQVAGKSGTAELGPAALEPGQVLEPGEDPPQEEDAWFATYAPVKKPELAIAVMLIETTGGGGTVAAPIAREIYTSVLD